jgi:hypothetical protein
MGESFHVMFHAKRRHLKGVYFVAFFLCYELRIIGAGKYHEKNKVKCMNFPTLNTEMDKKQR